MNYPVRKKADGWREYFEAITRGSNPQITELTPSPFLQRAGNVGIVQQRPGPHEWVPYEGSQQPEQQPSNIDIARAAIAEKSALREQAHIKLAQQIASQQQIHETPQSMGRKPGSSDTMEGMQNYSVNSIGQMVKSPNPDMILQQVREKTAQLSDPEQIYREWQNMFSPDKLWMLNEATQKRIYNSPEYQMYSQAKMAKTLYPFSESVGENAAELRKQLYDREKRTEEHKRKEDLKKLEITAREEEKRRDQEFEKKKLIFQAFLDQRSQQIARSQAMLPGGIGWTRQLRAESDKNLMELQSKLADIEGELTFLQNEWELREGDLGGKEKKDEKNKLREKMATLNERRQTILEKFRKSQSDVLGNVYGDEEAAENDLNTIMSIFERPLSEFEDLLFMNQMNERYR